MNWTAEQVLSLIEEYQKFPCLYAVKNILYHNRVARAEALEYIENALIVLRPCLKTEEIKSKFNSLRTTYLAEKRKYDKAKKSGDGRDFVYEPSLWYYHHMSFLNEHVVIRQSVSNIEAANSVQSVVESVDRESVSDDDDETKEFFLTNQNIEIIEDESENMSTETDEASQIIGTPKQHVTPKFSFTTPVRKRRKRTNTSANDDQVILREAGNALKDISKVLVNPPPSPAIQSSSTQEDLFGQLVSLRLKLTKNQRHRFEVQKKIYEILYHYLVNED